jgi:diaminopimelate decarboxylase
VPSELETVTRATLVYDLATIDATMRSVAAAAHAHEIRVLFAAKSFPHPAVLALAAHHLDGFDAASPGELAELPAAPIVSICDPTGRAIASSPATRQTRQTRVIASIETAAQLAAAPATAELAIRISASITGRDPAVGAVLDGSGHRRSRFGLDDRAAIAELVALAAARGRRWGLHVHHGPVTATTADRFLATAQTALALVDAEPAFLNLGGAWHGIADLPTAFAKLRAEIPRAIELVIEPGRTFAAGAGFACGLVTAARSLGDRELRMIDLSRACHLRWSPVELVAPAPHPGQSVLIVGPTCYEEDTLGEWTVDPLHVAERVIVRDVPGYALAWNTGFAGIPPAAVIIR